MEETVVPWGLVLGSDGTGFAIFCYKPFTTTNEVHELL